MLAFRSDYFDFLSVVKKQNLSSIVGMLTSWTVWWLDFWNRQMDFLFSSAAPYAFMTWTGTPLPSSENVD